jgi:hypothetical protein
MVLGQDLVIDVAAPVEPLHRGTPGAQAPLDYARRRMADLLNAVSREDAVICRA